MSKFTTTIAGGNTTDKKPDVTTVRDVITNYMEANAKLDTMIKSIIELRGCPNLDLEEGEREEMAAIRVLTEEYGALRIKIIELESSIIRFSEVDKRFKNSKDK